MDRIHRREVRRIRHSSQVRVASRVHRNTFSIIIPGSAQIRGIDQRVPSRIQLRHENVAHCEAAGERVDESSTAAGKLCLVGIRRRREVGRGRGSDNISIAPGVHGDGSKIVEDTAPVIAAAAQVSGVLQDGVNNERFLGIVGGHPKTNLVVSHEHVTALDIVLCEFRLPLFRLVNKRLMQPHLPSVQFRHQVTARINSDFCRALKSELDRSRVGARANNKVIFQLTLIAVVNQVHARVDTVIFHLGVNRNACPPLLAVFAKEVVALAGQFV